MDIASIGHIVTAESNLARGDAHPHHHHCQSGDRHQRQIDGVGGKHAAEQRGGATGHADNNGVEWCAHAGQGRELFGQVTLVTQGPEHP
ncbi:hypothetical protein D3C71_1695780 [compost metagenome]